MGTSPGNLDLSESEASLVGQVVDRYEIVGVVGRGGMGCVYEAINTRIQKRVAIKCIDSTLASNAEAVARFQREALAASAVESRHIVQIFDAGETDDGEPYIVMELLRGQDLGAHLEDAERMAVRDATHVVTQILKGLHHAHVAGIIHRDLKPDNVFLVDCDDELPFIKLLDFGVSKIARSEEVPLRTLTRQGTVVGTPFYMSPEQAQAFADVDCRTDIYSVGAILYECLSGRPPHDGKSYEQVIVNICMKDPVDIRQHNPDVSEELAEVLSTALRRERGERFKNAKAMLEALTAATSDSLRLALGSVRLVSKRASSGDVHDADWSTNEAPTRAAADERAVAESRRIIAPTPPSRPVAVLADTVAVGDTPAPDASRDDEDDAAVVPSADGDACGDLHDDDAVALSTLPSGAPRSRPPRRWLLAIAPGVAVLLGVVLFIRFGGSGDDGNAARDRDVDRNGAKSLVGAEPGPGPTAEAEHAKKADAPLPSSVVEAEEAPRLAASIPSSATARVAAVPPPRPASNSVSTTPGISTAARATADSSAKKSEPAELAAKRAADRPAVPPPPSAMPPPPATRAEPGLELIRE